MSDTGRKYYVLCDNNCKFESMTKEQIITAIAEATGATPTNIDDAFITKIKEQNKGVAVKVWIGTTAEYNAIAEKDAYTVYIKTDDTRAAEIDAAIKALQTELEKLYAGGLATDLEIADSKTTVNVAAFDYFILENNYGSGVISVTLNNIERTSTEVYAEGSYRHRSGGAGVIDYDYSVKFTKTDAGYTVSVKYRFNGGEWDDVKYTKIYGYKVGIHSGSTNTDDGGGVIDLANIPEVDSIDNPTAASPTAVKYDGEIYLLVEDN
jgi:hypothetical protein